MKPIAGSAVALGLFLVVAGVSAEAQNQAASSSQSSSSASSLGDYARQVRKDPGAKSVPKVFDNDNLPKQDRLSIVGQTPAPSSENKAEAGENASAETKPAADGTVSKAAAETKAATEAKPASDQKAPVTAPAKAPEDEAAKQAAAKQWTDKMNAQRQQIDLLSRELNVLQREYQIRAAAMYADAGNRLRNSSDWDKQDAQYKQQIADKQKELDDAKQKLSDMQEDARKAGAPASVTQSSE